ncbi:GAF domain-containing protein [Chitinimonas sp. BJB300]|uniref:GAF domain-containing protein n=1 Tax=Chitinimonas sp. BJB300 TaxID=1559339 RepID=UPI000C0DBBAD|nr:GAF domain-containing protein [Chitinimonas sp. BJB300]PHV10989.1 GGDEF domain-containing protein [Chitinimonas sp. BJB300]TSJ87545.1 diguanylate cyclase [Chitinimonas sp. BJB300]
MEKPALPENEIARITSLRNMRLLDTPDEATFDRITRIAKSLFDVPIALVSIVDVNRQWFKSCIGLPVRETGRDISFCGHTILRNETMVVADPLLDSRFADNPLVTGEPRIRFYAGYPIRNSEGFAIGTLCIIDRKPRTLSEEQLQLLSDLGVCTEEALLNWQVNRGRWVRLDEKETTGHQLLDPALGIWLQAPMMSLFERELARARSHRRCFTVADISLDRYNEYVALFGAQTGTEMLQMLVSQLRPHIKGDWTLGRYKQDELLLFAAVDAQQIYDSASTLYAVLNKLDPKTNGSDQMVVETSTSIGIVSVDFATYEQAFTSSDLLSAANAALFQARNEQGQRVCLLTMGEEDRTLN